MKTIFKNEIFDRVDNETAELRVKSGWKFASKSDWKKNVRDVEKAARAESEKAKAEAKAEKMSQKNSK